MAFFATLPLGVLLLVMADRAAARVAVAVYTACLAAGFGVSAAYHRLARSPAARRRLRRLDHSLIFVVIAGTYTPLCVLAPARVNLSEADFSGNHCVVSLSSFGSLIHTAVGSAGGSGGLRTKRSGCSA